MNVLNTSLFLMTVYVVTLSASDIEQGIIPGAETLVQRNKELRDLINQPLGFRDRLTKLVYPDKFNAKLHESFMPVIADLSVHHLRLIADYLDRKARVQYNACTFRNVAPAALIMLSGIGATAYIANSMLPIAVGGLTITGETGFCYYQLFEPFDSFETTMYYLKIVSQKLRERESQNH